MAIDGIFVINSRLEWYAINESVLYGCDKNSGVVDEIYKVSVFTGIKYLDESYTHCVTHQKWNTDYAVVDEHVIYYGTEYSCMEQMEHFRETYSKLVFDYSRFEIEAVFLEVDKDNETEIS